MKQFSSYFAQAYGQGVYSSCAYGDNTCTTSASSGGASSGANLTNTGFDLVLALTLACVLIFIALMVRLWRKPKRTLAAEVIPQDDQHDTDNPSEQN